jgi:hypothetical protein
VCIIVLEERDIDQSGSDLEPCKQELAWKETHRLTGILKSPWIT